MVPTPNNGYIDLGSIIQPGFERIVSDLLQM